MLIYNSFVLFNECSVLQFSVCVNISHFHHRCLVLNYCGDLKTLLFFIIISQLTWIWLVLVCSDATMITEELMLDNGFVDRGFTDSGIFSVLEFNLVTLLALEIQTRLTLAQVVAAVLFGVFAWLQSRHGNFGIWPFIQCLCVKKTSCFIKRGRIQQTERAKWRWQVFLCDLFVFSRCTT